MDQVTYSCGEFLVESSNRRFSRDGVEFVLEPKAFAVVLQLLSRPGELVTRDQLLDAVWGHRFVTPSTLNRIIALARRAFADDVESPRFIQTVHGAGYRFIGPVARQSGAGAGNMPARFGPPVAARLPAPLEALIGRRDEIEQLATLLREGRAVTVVGTGGMGKTQCALAFAHNHADDYPDGVWFFDLVPLQRAEQWLELLGRALAIPPTDERELLEKVARAFADRRVLLVLDNCDRLSTAVGTTLVKLLRATDQVKVLATSQQKLSFVGEKLLRMPPLALPVIREPVTDADLPQIAAAPAVALLLARIRSVQPEFLLHRANAAAIVEICARLDGMPLALELAAARFALLSPEQVLERLALRFRFLTSDAAGRDARHRNLEALLEWSFGLLSPDERQLLAWLGVFVQGWTVDAVVALAEALGRDPESMVDLLTGLANKSLVAVNQALSPPRYRLLESVREFALVQLVKSGEETRARQAHLAYVCRMAATVHRDLVSGRMRERVALLLHEHGNIESASEYALGAGNDPQAALHIAGSLMLYFKAHGSNALGLRLCERALHGAPVARTHVRCLALMSRGVNGLMMHSATSADSALLEAVSIAREVGDPWAVAYASGYLAQWKADNGQGQHAGPEIAVVEQIAQQLSDENLLGLAGLARGWMYLAANEVDKTIAVLQSVRRLGDDVHQHHFIDVYIGLALFRRGDFAAAAGLWLEAMRNALIVGHIRGAAGSMEGCGYIAQRLNQPQLACRCLGAAQQIRTRTGIPLYSFWVPHYDSAHAALRTALGPAAYATAIAAGAAMHEEDAASETAQWLQSFASASIPGYRSESSPRAS
ncbi:MAG TPA: winged helix-turn-helix domain-containing protein [Steroidobacteraceae bacterium]|nr:winged helix-turn-helix domain-containing protein [Steroidobacteraceae bacterium]